MSKNIMSLWRYLNDGKMQLSLPAVRVIFGKKQQKPILQMGFDEAEITV